MEEVTLHGDGEGRLGVQIPPQLVGAHGSEIESCGRDSTCRKDHQQHHTQDGTGGRQARNCYDDDQPGLHGDNLVNGETACCPTTRSGRTCDRRRVPSWGSVRYR
ncbi:Uncharacterised protein [Mycobacteroides abscessus subsp. massiliense]|nr:Uncharacterised protein [Mycobacteroides abscessus subsp. massiliense]